MEPQDMFTVIEIVFTKSHFVFVELEALLYLLVALIYKNDLAWFKKDQIIFCVTNCK